VAKKGEEPVKKETQKVMFSSEQTDWETPDWLFDLLNSEFEFTLDVCATKENAKTSKYITPKENALTKDWNSGVCWMNPPYGRDIGQLHSCMPCPITNRYKMVVELRQNW